jgi:hypothetical protein
MQRVGSFKGSSLFLVGAAHTLENIKWNKNKKPKAFSAFKYMNVDSSIAVIPKSVIDGCGTILDDYRASSIAPDFGVWVEGKQNVKVAGGLLGFSAVVVVWVDGEDLLPCATVCLVRQVG